MRNIKKTFMILTMSFVAVANAQSTVTSFGRDEYITVEKNVKLHVTDLGKGNLWF